MQMQGNYPCLEASCEQQQQLTEFGTDMTVHISAVACMWQQWEQ
jgi:hypothetical protein